MKTTYIVCKTEGENQDGPIFKVVHNLPDDTLLPALRYAIRTWLHTDPEAQEYNEDLAGGDFNWGDLAIFDLPADALPAGVYSFFSVPSLPTVIVNHDERLLGSE